MLDMGVHSLVDSYVAHVLTGLGRGFGFRFVAFGL